MPSGLDVTQFPSVQDAYWPIPGLMNCSEVTRGVGIHTMPVLVFCSLGLMFRVTMYLYVVI